MVVACCGPIATLVVSIENYDDLGRDLKTEVPKTEVPRAAKDLKPFMDTLKPHSNKPLYRIKYGDWPSMCGLLYLVQRGRDCRAGYGPAQ